ncbi:uncharacterized protein LOC119077133 [Bradysia coprophila]|uniref:uncharacterized protein LOC119077133 n=1 Tax=Bradysia coprophila TaxID=38358 RepID=UPI00187DC698|nr:uncharacterized protein LOC119077133 [Bradysia coprophila]
MRAFRNFNHNYSQHAPNRAKLLSELSAFLTWTPEQFAIHNVADNLSIVEFFRKLNEILLTDEVNCDYHWTVFKVIDIAINNSETRQYLVDTVRIISGIASYAVKGSSSLIEEKQIQVWKLVDRITTGMAVVTEEPHLSNLIDHLVTSVKRTDLNQEIKMLQVSILTNLCFKNEIAVACLLRFTKSRDLLQAIEGYKVYWGKMSMALARFDSTMLEFELHLNLKTIFAVEYFSQLMRNNDQRMLRNVLDMLAVGFERDEHSRQTMQHFDFKESIEAVLTLIDDSEISFQNFELTSVFLGIVNSIFSVSNTSLESSIPRLFKLIIDNTNPSNILSEAIKTVRLIASTVTDSHDLTPFIILLIENLQSHQNDLPVAIEAYKLLIELYEKHPAIQLPQEILIKTIDTDTWSYKLTDTNLSMQIRRLQWLVSYSNINEDDILRRKVADIMSKKDVHQIFASGLRGSDEEICALTMELIKSQHFPVRSVSKILSGTFTPSLPNNEHHDGHDCRSSVEVVRPYFSASLETRLNNEVDRLKLKTDNSENVGMNDYLSMLEYQNIVANAKQENLLTQIKALSDLNTLQSNEIGGLKLTIRNSLNKISELESKLENLKNCSDTMKTAYNSIKIKYDNRTTKFNDVTRKYDALRSESERVLTEISQQLADQTSQYEKDREMHVTNLAQLKKDHDREKTDLGERHRKQVEELTEKYQQKEKKLKTAHEQDLEKYSAKRSEMKKRFEQEKAELLDLHKKENQAAHDKIENMEKELAAKVEQIKHHSRAINEKTVALSDMDKRLEEAGNKVQYYKELYEKIQGLLGGKI